MTAPSPELFFETMFAAGRTAALKAAIDLGVFTAIGDGAQNAASVAAQCQASERGIRILCDNLAAIGFLVKRDDAYELTADSSMFLSKRSPAYLGSAAEFLGSAATARSLAQLTDTVRRGTVAADSNNVSENNPVWVMFARAMGPLMVPQAHVIADVLSVDTMGPMRVLDVAAGHGMFGIVIAVRNPSAQIVAVDWEPVLAVAIDNAQSMGVAERLTTLPGDAFQIDYGNGFDVVLLANFLHHFDRSTCVTFLRNVHTALKPGGRLAMLEFVPNEDRISPPLPAAFSLTMLASTPAGEAYTFGEHRSMLEEAGFDRVAAHTPTMLETIIVATA